MKKKKGLKIRKKVEDELLDTQDEVRQGREHKHESMIEEIQEADQLSEEERIEYEKDMRSCQIRTDSKTEIDNLWLRDMIPCKYPEKITDYEIIMAARRAHGIIGFTARILGVDRSYLDERIHNSQKLKLVFANERENIIDIAEAKLFESVANNAPWAILFLLRTIGKRRGYTEEFNTTDNKSKILEAINGMVNGKEDKFREYDEQQKETG
jgi:hypothetical protein